MKMKSWLLSAAALCAGLTGYAGEAQASYTVRVDCHGDNGLPTWADTSDTITVQAIIGTRWILLGSQTMVGWCNQDAIWVLRKSARDMAASVDAIVISTSGSNAFFIDRVELFEGYLPDVPSKLYTPKLQAAWGESDSKGWCLSTDASDGNYGSCLGATAAQAWKFYFN